MFTFDRFPAMNTFGFQPSLYFTLCIPWCISNFQWTQFSVIIIYKSNIRFNFVKLTNLNLLALAFDSAVILIIKAFVRRKRPPTRNPDYFTAIGPDQYSFPSGHASRTVLISFIFTQINPLFGNGYLNFVASLLIWSWSISVCFSRMLNGRHHLLDVVTGAVIGFVEGSLVISALWMSSEKAENILKFIYYDQDNWNMVYIFSEVNK